VKTVSKFLKPLSVADSGPKVEFGSAQLSGIPGCVIIFTQERKVKQGDLLTISLMIIR